MVAEVQGTLAPFQRLLSEMAGYPTVDHPVSFERRHKRSTCWWLMWGHTMDDAGLLFGPGNEIAGLLAHQSDRSGANLCLDGRVVVAHFDVAIRRDDPKNEVIAKCIRHFTVPRV